MTLKVEMSQYAKAESKVFRVYIWTLKFFKEDAHFSRKIFSIKTLFLDTPGLYRFSLVEEFYGVRLLSKCLNCSYTSLLWPI